MQAVCPFPATSQVTSGEKRGLQGVCPPFPVHPWSHLEGRQYGRCPLLPARSRLEGKGLGRCVCPSQSIPAHGRALNGHDPCPFHPKPSCGKDPAILYDPCKLDFCPEGCGGCLGTQLEPHCPVSSSVAMTRQCPSVQRLSQCSKHSLNLL